MSVSTSYSVEYEKGYEDGINDGNVDAAAKCVPVLRLLIDGGFVPTQLREQVDQVLAELAPFVEE